MWKRGTGKGRHNRVRPQPRPQEHLNPDEEGQIQKTLFRILLTSQAGPHIPGQTCWDLDIAQPARLVPVTTSQEHVVSQCTMVTSLKHPDRRSTIMKPNQSLWGDEWFQYNPKSESRKGKWRTSLDAPTEKEKEGCQLLPSELLSLPPVCLGFLPPPKRRVWLTFFFFFLDNSTPISNSLFFFFSHSSTLAAGKTMTFLSLSCEEGWSFDLCGQEMEVCQRPLRMLLLS